MNPRGTIFILALLSSSPLFAQVAAVDKDKGEALSKAIGIAQNIYSDTRKNALSMVSMTRNCAKAYPNLKEKIKANLLSDASGLDQKTRDEVAMLEASKDPYVRGQIDGASIVTYDKDLMESGCKALAGVGP